MDAAPLRRRQRRQTAPSTGPPGSGHPPGRLAQSVLIDVMPPGLDGFDICRRHSRSSDVPIIFGDVRLIDRGE